MNVDTPSHVRLSLNFQCKDLHAHFLPERRRLQKGIQDGQMGARRTIVVREGITAQEPNQTVQLADSVLEGRPR